MNKSARKLVDAVDEFPIRIRQNWMQLWLRQTLGERSCTIIGPRKTNAMSAYPRFRIRLQLCATDVHVKLVITIRIYVSSSLGHPVASFDNLDFAEARLKLRGR